MRPIHRAFSRVLITTATIGAATSIALISGAAPAWAHVHVAADDAAPGGSAILTFQVPGESETGALTMQFSVALPNVASARAEVMPGWTSRLDRNVAAGTTSSVTWTAAPSVGISPDQFALFRISVTLPNQPSVSLPSTQTYSDGQVVHWDQQPLPGGGEPEHPAPIIALPGTAAPEHAMAGSPAPEATAAPTGQPVAQAPVASDDTARWLAGGALLVAAVGVVLAVAGRRRT
jgi:uncharacterized protein YcnI